MQQTFIIIQTILAITLIVLILLQHRGTALGGAFGGEGNIYRSRRGIEKFLFWGATVIAVLFVLISVVSLFSMAR